MIKNLEVKNFKSIKHLKLDCKKVNIFIGKPNTGKSNILESVGLFSIRYGHLRDFVRFENMTNLFYDQEVSEKIEIIFDDIDFQTTFQNGVFSLRAYQIQTGDPRVIPGQIQNFGLDLGFEGRIISGNSQHSLPFKFYKFAIINSFNRTESDFLLPPGGENLLQILLTHKTLRKFAIDIFSEFGLKIVLEPYEKKIKVQKEEEGVAISYPYSLISDTLQRVVFYFTAIETNKNSILIFEEPEAHTFPYYTKFLAEKVALDKTNQYFISTHNPYFLLSVLEKTSKDDIGIFITYSKDYRTKIRPILEEEMTEILDLDTSVFFNLDRFLEPE